MFILHSAHSISPPTRSTLLYKLLNQYGVVSSWECCYAEQGFKIGMVNNIFFPCKLTSVSVTKWLNDSYFQDKHLLHILYTIGKSYYFKKREKEVYSGIQMQGKFSLQFHHNVHHCSSPTLSTMIETPHSNPYTHVSCGQFPCIQYKKLALTREQQVSQRIVSTLQLCKPLS